MWKCSSCWRWSVEVVEDVGFVHGIGVSGVLGV